MSEVMYKALILTKNQEYRSHTCLVIPGCKSSVPSLVVFHHWSATLYRDVNRV